MRTCSLAERRTGRVYPLGPGKEACVIGRSSDTDVTLADARVSRSHARLSSNGSAWFLEDLDSSNGTWLNGVPVGRRVAIRPGDSITVGGTVLVFVAEADPLTEHAGAAVTRRHAVAGGQDPAVEAEVERRRRDRELELAREIQVGLLQRRLPAPPGYSVHAGCVPSLQVSGDFYRVVERKGGRELLLMVVDAAGKGVCGALLTVSVEALSAAPIAAGLEPQQVLELVAELLHARTSSAHFATAVVVALDVETGRLRCANAGHLPGLILRRNGEIQELGSTGLPLGLFPGQEYGASLAVLERGDSVVLYTDGVTEAENPEGEQFGRTRLAGLCSKRPGSPPGLLARHIESAVRDFADGILLADDRTVVVVRRDP